MLQGQRPTIYVLLLSPNPKFKSVLLQGQLFCVNGHFETCTPNDPKITLTTKNPKVPQTHFMTAHNSQILLRFSIWPAIFKLQAILRQGPWMTPKWPWTVKGTRYTCYNLPPPPPPPVTNFTQFCSMASRFRLACHFETSALNYPKMTINTKRSKVSHICCRSTESQISLLFTLQKAVFELQAILRQVHWMAPKRFWTLKVKGTLDTCYNYPRIPNFTVMLCG